MTSPNASARLADAAGWAYLALVAATFGLLLAAPTEGIATAPTSPTAPTILTPIHAVLGPDEAVGVTPPPASGGVTPPTGRGPIDPPPPADPAFVNGAVTLLVADTNHWRSREARWADVLANVVAEAGGEARLGTPPVRVVSAGGAVAGWSPAKPFPRGNPALAKGDWGGILAALTPASAKAADRVVWLVDSDVNPNNAVPKVVPVRLDDRHRASLVWTGYNAPNGFDFRFFGNESRNRLLTIGTSEVGERVQSSLAEYLVSPSDPARR